MALHGHFHAVLEEGRPIFEEVAGELELVVSDRVHEDEHVALGVEVLIVVLFKPHALDRFGGAKAFVQLGAVDQVFELDLGVGRPFSGLHMLGLDGDPQPILVLDDVAGTDLVAVDLHGSSMEVLGVEFGVGAFWTCRPATVKGERGGLFAEAPAVAPGFGRRLRFFPLLLGELGEQKIE